MLTRSFSTQALKVVNNVAKQQFVVSVLDALATIDYKQLGSDITFIHTNVPEAFQGKGVGKLLAKHAFDYAHVGKLNVTCQCHFLAKYYNDNLKNYKELKVLFDLE